MQARNGNRGASAEVVGSCKQHVWGAIVAGLVTAALVTSANAQVIDFEDLPLGATTTCGAPPLVSGGVPIIAETFFYGGGGSTCNDAEVISGFVNASQNLGTWNVNCRFLFPGPVNGLSLEYAYGGGNNNLRVNGEFINVASPAGYNGVWGFPALGQINVQVVGNQIILTPLTGAIYDFAIGGQEFAIDNLRYDIDDCINSTPPVADVLDPLNGGCICGTVDIKGTADDPDDGLDSYVLRYRALFDPTWTVFDGGTTPVVNGPLGTFDPIGLGLPQGIYLIELKVINDCGDDEEVLIAVYYDSALDELRLDSPAHGDIVGGVVCFDGTVWDNGCFDYYTVGYRDAGSADPFTPVDPGNPIYTGTKINQVFATWDTVNLGIPDGDYEIEIYAQTDCGHTASLTLVLTVDNTVPIAEITSPENCDDVSGAFEVIGTAFDENISSWSLQFTGGPYNTWQTIATGNTNVIDDLLAVWDVSNLPPCCYTLRLVVVDKAVLNCNPAIHHRTEFEVSLNVNDEPCPLVGDINGDGAVNFGDIDPFVALITGG